MVSQEGMWWVKRACGGSGGHVVGQEGMWWVTRTCGEFGGHVVNQEACGESGGMW